MKLAALLMLTLLGGCAGASQTQQGFQPKLANPSAVIAADIGLARASREKGPWSALRQAAASDAILFLPQPVLAQQWSQAAISSSAPISWQPHKAFMSCDGKTGVITGAAQWPGGRSGYSTTVWQLRQRSPQDAGEWQWVVHHANITEQIRAVPDMIETSVASCKGRAPAELAAPPEMARMKAGYSPDQSLSYVWVVQPDGARTLEIKLWDGTSAKSVLLDRVAVR
jgi:hypothetical protein